MSAHPALADRLEATAATLAANLVSAQYGDPVQGARFGAQGRTVATEAAMLHLEQLARALRAGDAAPLEAYARSRQTALVTQGMTSRHLANDFHHLADAVQATGDPEWGAARTMLDRAALALRYDLQPAASIQDASRQLAEDAVITLRGVHLGDFQAEAEWVEALETLVSYLADAVAADRPAILGEHVRWLAAAPPSLRPADPVAMLGALEGALDELPEPARSLSARCLAAARAAAADRG